MTQSVLISGLGIAGPALAHWLLRHGFAVSIVERAPQLRRGGYLVDFWGRGYDIAEQMGLLPAVLRASYQIRQVQFIDAAGLRTGGFATDVFHEVTAGRFTSLPRGELAAILHDSIAGRAEVMFGNSIVALEDRSSGALVHFERGPARCFDLVIGADGMRSNVRRLVFGADAGKERFFNYVVAAFEVAHYPFRDENVFLSFSAPGLQVSRFALREDRTMFLLVLAEDRPQAIDPHDAQACKAYLRGRLSGLRWECPQVLGALERCGELYCDRVSQIRLERWSTGRVALLGDAAYAPSLLAGQGSALAMLGAYVLAGELANCGSHERAFPRYESLLRPMITAKQNAAGRFARSFAPRTQTGIRVRNALSGAMGFAPFAKLFLGASLRDRVALPDYVAGERRAHEHAVAVRS